MVDYGKKLQPGRLVRQATQTFFSGTGSRVFFLGASVEWHHKNVSFTEAASNANQFVSHSSQFMCLSNFMLLSDPVWGTASVPGRNRFVWSNKADLSNTSINIPRKQWYCYTVISCGRFSPSQTSRKRLTGWRWGGRWETRSLSAAATKALVREIHCRTAAFSE